MRKRFFIALGLMFVVTVVFALRLLNDSLPGRFGSSDSLLSQVTPGPNEALYFVSPSSGSHNVGNTFQVELRLASSAGVTSMKAYLNFNSSLLQVTNVSTTGGAFQTYWEATSTSNQVRLQGSSPTPGVSGNNNLVATITFQALAAGTASLTYDASSLALKSDDTNILNIGGSQTGSYTLVSDTTAPSATISINSGASSTSTTSVTLSLTCTDTSGVKDVRYSNDGVFDTEVFEAFAASKAWSLSGGDGTKTVSYQCRDNSLNQNIATVSDTIVFDTTAPSVPSGISYSPNPNKTGTHTVSWNASSDAGSGVAAYDVRRSLNGGGSWTTVASGLAGTNFVQSPAVGAGNYIYQARAVDNAGNQS
ncbi:MAG TPA: cohesin domain-containing protein, partial [Candidatus Paceibacterota bacterium]|nr:cohesin domain-containing protein [Candidatus Paceibacterota bacterium]